MASLINDYFSPFMPVTNKFVTFTPGVTGLNEMFAMNLADEGDGILLGTPSYGSFHTDLTVTSKFVNSPTAFRTSLS
jgi:1-aminocyclopropane-1-carboxylate synthase